MEKVKQIICSHTKLFYLQSLQIQEVKVEGKPSGEILIFILCLSVTTLAGFFFFKPQFW